jgi:hypothetical protein
MEREREMRMGKGWRGREEEAMEREREMRMGKGWRGREEEAMEREREMRMGKGWRGREEEATTSQLEGQMRTSNRSPKRPQQIERQQRVRHHVQHSISTQRPIPQHHVERWRTEGGRLGIQRMMGRDPEEQLP